MGKPLAAWDRPTGISLLVLAVALVVPLVVVGPMETCSYLFQRAEHEWGRALEALEGGDLKGARSALKRASAAGSAGPAVALLLGDVQARLGDLPGAEEQLRSAVVGSEGAAVAMARLGDVLARSGRRKEALDAYGAALGKEPDEGLRGRVKASRDGIARGLAVAAYNKGSELYGSGSLAGARDAWREAVALSPDRKLRKKAKANVRAVKKIGKGKRRLKRLKALPVPKPAEIDPGTPTEVLASLRASRPAGARAPSRPPRGLGVVGWALSLLMLGGLGHMARRVWLSRQRRYDHWILIGGCAALGVVLVGMMWRHGMGG